MYLCKNTHKLQNTHKKIILIQKSHNFVVSLQKRGIDSVYVPHIGIAYSSIFLKNTYY